MYRRARLAGAGIAVLLSTAAVHAASVQVETFAMGQTDAARAAYAAATTAALVHVTEDFEGFAAWNGTTGTANPVATRVGSVRGESPLPGSGGSAVNGGAGLEVRADLAPGVPGSYTALSGRSNTSPGGRNWLDSNDLKRMIWDADGGPGTRTFDSLIFLLTDVGDIRGTDFAIAVEGGGETASLHVAPQANGTINLVRILFDRAVGAATVTLTSARNDGFGIDDLTVARVTPVPLPPVALLLFGAIAGLGWVGAFPEGKWTYRKKPVYICGMISPPPRTGCHRPADDRPA